MDIKAEYGSLEEIPTDVSFADLFTQKGDKWELTGIDGVRPKADVDRIQTTLNAERKSHKETRAKLGAWGDLEPEKVQSELDRISELEAAAGDKLDDAKIEEIVNRRVEGQLRSKLAPIERENKKLALERDEALKENGEFKASARERRIKKEIRAAAKKMNLQDGAEDDAMMHIGIFDITEDDTVITRDGVGVTPGIDAEGWLTEILPNKPHWQHPSQGSNANPRGGPKGFAGANPFTAEHWNSTEQGRIVTTKGAEFAEKLAAAAGTTLGGPKPSTHKAGT